MVNGNAVQEPGLISCCPSTLEMLYVRRNEANLLHSALPGALVVAHLPPQQGQQAGGWRLCQVVNAAYNAETGIESILLCDGSKVSLEQLCDTPFGAFHRQQLDALCCGLSWRMRTAQRPRLCGDEVREHTGTDSQIGVGWEL